MISQIGKITRLLRNGRTLVLQVAEERAEIERVPVDWEVAQRYVRRLRHGYQPDLARRVLIEYPDHSVMLENEGWMYSCLEQALPSPQMY